MKKIISVLPCIAMLFTFMTVIAAAEDAGTPDGGSSVESILTMLMNLLKQVDWSKILTVLTQTIATLSKLFGGGA